MNNEHLNSVLRPVETANGLPNEHYISEEVFAEERDSVLFANWSGIGFAKDVPEVGDANPIEFLGMPLVAVRGKDGNVRVFQNTCRHRGMILLSERKKVGGVLRCPYHSWCYSLKGDLVATPHVGGPGVNAHKDVDKEKLGLVEIRSHVWRDVIFVNIDGQAPAFEVYAAAVKERWSEFEGQTLYHSGEDSGFKFDANCNWKLAIENFCESYHLPWIHPGLNSYSRLEDHYHIEEPGHFSGQGTRVYRPMITEDGRRFTDFAGLSEKWDAGGEYISVFPNVMLGVHRDQAFAIVLEPISQSRTIEHIELYYASEDSIGDAYAQERKTVAEMWYDVFEEDIMVIEGMQKGRQGRFFDGGRFSPAMDGPTHLFHHWVASQLSSAPLAAE